MSCTNSNCIALLAAVKKVNYAQTQKLLSDHGLPIDDKWNDYKILIHAVHKGNTEIVKLLLRYGCRVKSSRSNFCKTPLCYAVNNLNLEMVKVLLEAGASITDKDHNLDTPLYMAAKKKFFPAVALMLSKYNVTNIDVTNNDEIIHFHIACISNNVNLVKSFIRCGMNVNTYVDNNADMYPGFSPLHFAVEHKCVEVVELLLSYGANYTFLNADKLSPLHIAYYLENSAEKYQIMDYIIYLHGTNTAANNPVDNKGVSHFHIACTRHNKEAIKNFLKSGAVINCPTSTGYYPLHFAVVSGDKEIVKVLVKYGARVNIEVENSTLLHIALKNKSPLIAKLLLDYGANVCAKDHNDCTPIHKAYHDLPYSYEIFMSLMSVHQGKMTNVTDKYGLSIFHIACAVGDTTAVDNFLQRNVDINACLGMNSGGLSGFTGLHFAAMNYHEDVIKLLLKYKANVNALDKNGRSAIWLAVQFIINEMMVYKLNENLLKNQSSYDKAGVSEEEVMSFMHQEVRKIPIIKLLAENRSNLNRPNEHRVPLLFKAYNPDLIWKVKGNISNKNFIKSICKKYHFACLKEIFEIFIKNGIGFYVPGINNDSILHLMATDSDRNENLEIAEMLLINGCNPNFKNVQGKTALHIVAENGCIEYARILLKYKANPNCVDQYLLTPLHYAAQKHAIDDFTVETSHAKIMQLLIHNGADVEAKDIKGCTPLFAAVKHRQTIKALLCLLKANCQVNICNNRGESPLLVAAKKRNAYSVKLLLDYGADINLTHKNMKCGLLKNIFSIEDPIGFFHSSFIETFKILELHIEKLRLIDYPVNLSDLIYRKYLGVMLANRIFTNVVDIFIQANEDDFEHGDFNLPEEDNFITPMLQGELERMKDIKIDKYTSLYDILFKNEKQMVKHVKNETFNEYLNEETLDTEFQHYGYILKLKYRQGMERYVLLEPAKESLRQLIRQDLPDLCFDGIFVYFSNANLKSLIDVCI